MDKESPPFNLSDKAVFRLTRGEEVKNDTAVLQVVKVNTTKHKVKIILSDGYIKEKAVMIGIAKDKFQKQPLKNNDIVKFQIKPNDEGNLKISSYKPIYTQGLIPLVGKPITYNQYIDNDCEFDDEAQSDIPKQVWASIKINHGDASTRINSKSPQITISVERVKEQEIIDSFLPSNRFANYIPEQDLTLISDLTLFTKSYRIKARIIRKGKFRRYFDHSGPKAIQRLLLLDKSGQIWLTISLEQIIEYEELLNEGSVYIIEGARICKATKDLDISINKWQLVSNKRTEITKVNVQHMKGFPLHQPEFTKISEIAELPEYTRVNLLGVVCRKVFLKKGKLYRSLGEPIDRNSFYIGDNSKAIIKVLVLCENPIVADILEGKILFLQGVVVRFHKGTKTRNIVINEESHIEINPKGIEGLGQLKGWYKKLNSLRSETVNLSRKPPSSKKSKPLSLIRSEATECLFSGKYKSMMFNSEVAIVKFPKIMTWSRKRGNQEQEMHFFHKIQFYDQTDKIWANFNDATALQIIGKSASEIGNYVKNFGELEPAFKKELKECLKKWYNVKISAKLKYCRNGQKVIYSIVSTQEILRVKRSSIASLTDYLTTL